MAKDFDLDPYDIDNADGDEGFLDDNFDIGFDDDIDSDNRDPVGQIITGTKDGIFEEMGNVGGASKMLLKSTLPKGMKREESDLDDTLVEISEKYGKLSGEVKDSVQGIASTISDSLPDGKLKSLVSKFTKDEEEERAETVREDNENSINLELDEIFKKAKENEVKTQLRTETLEVAREKRAEVRDAFTKEILLGIKDNTGATLEYTTSINSSYQRKSLELKFKHVFLTEEMLSDSKKFYEIATKSLTAINKNTSLPDYNKLRGIELAEKRGLEGIMGLAGEAATKEDGVLSRTARNVSNYAYDKISNKAEALAEANNGLAELAMMKSQLESLPTKERAKMVVSELLPLVLRQSVERYARRNGGDNLFNKTRNRLYSYLDDLPSSVARKIDEHNKKSEEDEDNIPEDETRTQSFLRAGKDILRSGKRAGLSVVSDALHYDVSQSFTIEQDKAESGAEFDMSFYKSVTHDIPTYLSKILQSTESSRLGYETSEMVIDVATGKLIFKDVLKSNIRSDLKNNKEVNEFNKNTDEFIETEFKDYIGNDSAKRKEMKALFRELAVSTNVRGRRYNTFNDLKNLARDMGYTELSNELGERHESLRETNEGTRHAGLRTINNLVPSLRDVSKATNEAYGRDGLEGLGLFSRDENGNYVMQEELVRKLFSGELERYVGERTNSGDVKHSDYDLFSSIKETISGAASNIQKTSVDKYHKMSSSVKEKFKRAKKAKESLDGDKIQDAVKGVYDDVAEVVEESLDPVRDKLAEAKENLEAAIDQKVDPDVKKDVSERIIKSRDALTETMESVKSGIDKLNENLDQKRAYNDKDGDGFRDGSYRGRKHKENPETFWDGKAAEGSDTEKSSLMGRLLGGGAGLLGAGLGLLGSLFGKGGGLAGGALSLAGTAAGGVATLGKKIIPHILKAARPLLFNPVTGPAVGALSLAAGLWYYSDDIAAFFEGGLGAAADKGKAKLTSFVKSSRDTLDEVKWMLGDFAGDVKDVVSKAASDSVDWLANKIKDDGTGPSSAHGEFNEDIGGWDDDTVKKTKIEPKKEEDSKDLMDIVRDISMSGGLTSYLAFGIGDALRSGHDDLIYLRMRQYGIGMPKDNTGIVDRILRMERILVKNRGFQLESGMWVFKPRESIVSALWQVSGLSRDRYKKNFIHWVLMRFIPVALSHMNALHALGYPSNLGSPIKVVGANVSKFINLAINGVDNFEKVYSDSVNPFEKRGIDVWLTDPKAIEVFGEDYVAKYKSVEQDPTAEIKRELNITRRNVNKRNTATGKLIDTSLELNDGGYTYTPPKVKPEASGIIDYAKVFKEPSNNVSYDGIKYNTKNPMAISGLNDAVRANFLMMAAEYKKETGKDLNFNSGWRSRLGQMAQHGANPDLATDKLSAHELGFAIDVNAKDVDTLMELGLLNKYGFNRPLGGGKERWHIEPTVLQGKKNRSLLYKNPELMTQLFDQGKGVISAGLGDANPKIKTAIVRDKTPAVKLTDDMIENAKSSIRPTEVSNLKENRGIKPSTVAKTLDKNLGTSKVSVDEAITKASRKYNIDKQLLKLIFAKESSLNPTARPPINPKTGKPISSAEGLGQATDAMWSDWLSSPDSVGFSKDKTDPLSAAMAGAWYTRNNMKSLKSVTGGQTGPVEVYLITLLGPTGARSFMSKYNSSPSSLVSETLTSAQIRGNRAYFLSGKRIRTYAEAYSAIESSLKKTAKEFNIQWSGKTRTKPATDIRNAATPSNVVAQSYNSPSENNPYEVYRRPSLREQTPRAVQPPSTVNASVTIPKSSFTGVENWLAKNNQALKDILDELKTIKETTSNSSPEETQRTTFENRVKDRPARPPFNVSN